MALAMFSWRKSPTFIPTFVVEAPTQLEIVLRNRLANKAERLDLFKHAELGNVFRCLAAVFEFEEEYTALDKRSQLLHCRKLANTFLESGSRLEISLPTLRGIRERIQQGVASASLTEHVFAQLKAEMLNLLQSNGLAKELLINKFPSSAERDARQRVIAVLDDSAIVRLAIGNLLPTLLQAHTSSFVRGQTRAECQGFVHEIIQQNVDLAILDENLEYEDEDYSVLGHDLGAQARELGFKGCLILHTTVPKTAFPAEHLLAFDGHVQKCDGRRFAELVNAIWTSFATTDGL